MQAIAICSETKLLRRWHLGLPGSQSYLRHQGGNGSSNSALGAPGSYGRDGTFETFVDGCMALAPLTGFCLNPP
eukprot:176422-Amphidinium_carterae.3